MDSDIRLSLFFFGGDNGVFIHEYQNDEVGLFIGTLYFCSNHCSFAGGDDRVIAHDSKRANTGC